MKTLPSPVALGVGMSLIVGKTPGINRFNWRAVRLRQHMTRMVTTADIGFTVALLASSGRSAFKTGKPSAGPTTTELEPIGV